MHAAIPQVLPVPVDTGVVVPASLRVRAGSRNTATVVAHPAWCDVLPRLDADRLFASATRVVLVAPRPGDGVETAGGLLAAAARSDLPIWAWVLTDGDVADATSWRPRLDGALDALGVRSGGIERFRLPMGSLQPQRDLLGDRLRRLLQPGDVVLAPQSDEGDPDAIATMHVVAAAAVHVSCNRLGVVPHGGWSAAALQGAGLRRLELDPDLSARKRAACRAFDARPADRITRQPSGILRASFELLATS